MDSGCLDALMLTQTLDRLIKAWYTCRYSTTWTADAYPALLGIQTMWNGYYLIHPEHNVYTQTIAGVVHIVTGIGGKGMSTGLGFARSHIASVLA